MTDEEKKAKDDATDLLLLHALKEFQRTRHAGEAQLLFNAHNGAGWPTERGHTCGACIQRVVGRVTEHLRAKGLLD